MDFELSEEQKSLVALARDFCKRETSPELWRECMKKPPEERMPWNLMKKLDEVGLRTLAMPKKYDGGGFTDLLTSVVIMDAVGQLSPPLGGMLGMNILFHLNLAAWLNEDQQDEFFPILKNDYHLTIGAGYTEPDVASDFKLPYDVPGAGFKTTAYKDGNEWVLNGEKIFGDGASDVQVVIASTDKNKPISQSSSLFWLPKATPGYRVGKPELGLSRLRPRVGFSMENCKIPERYLIGEENKGLAMVEECRMNYLVIYAIELGQTQAIWELTKEYAKTRVQGGKPIFEHLNIGPRIVDMRLDIEAARALIYKTAWEYDQIKSAPKSPLWANLCYVFIKKVRVKVAETVAEIWGGFGAVDDSPVRAYVVDSLTSLHEFSTPTFNLVKSMQEI